MRNLALAIQVKDSGKNNIVEIADQKLLHGAIEADGDNNRIRIGSECRSQAFHIKITGSGCTVEIGHSCNLSAVKIFAQQDATIRIGDHSGFTWLTQIQCHEPSSVEIGEGFLCASETLITSSDMHAIFDLKTGRRINQARDIRIGSSVWIGQRVTILKGAKIGQQSVIGANSVVAGAIPANVIAGGSPARVIREGIYWKHELTEVDPAWTSPSEKQVE